MRILLSLATTAFLTLAACGGDVSLGKDESPVKSGGGSCSVDGKTYANGESYSTTDGCNSCTCTNGASLCTKRACVYDGGSAPVCTYDGKTYSAGEAFPSGDGCNTCSCEASGSIICTARACAVTCTYDGKGYNAGDSFPATDGCNTCSCMPSGKVLCTLRACAIDGGSAP